MKTLILYPLCLLLLLPIINCADSHKEEPSETKPTIQTTPGNETSGSNPLDREVWPKIDNTDFSDTEQRTKALAAINQIVDMPKSPERDKVIEKMLEKTYSQDPKKNLVVELLKSPIDIQTKKIFNFFLNEQKTLLLKRNFLPSLIEPFLKNPGQMPPDAFLRDELIVESIKAGVNMAGDLFNIPKGAQLVAERILGAEPTVMPLYFHNATPEIQGDIGEGAFLATANGTNDQAISAIMKSTDPILTKADKSTFQSGLYLSAVADAIEEVAIQIPPTKSLFGNYSYDKVAFSSLERLLNKRKDYGIDFDKTRLDFIYPTPQGDYKGSLLYMMMVSIRTEKEHLSFTKPGSLEAFIRKIASLIKPIITKKEWRKYLEAQSLAPDGTPSESALDIAAKVAGTQGAPDMKLAKKWLDY